MKTWLIVYLCRNVLNNFCKIKFFASSELYTAFYTSARVKIVLKKFHNYYWAWHWFFVQKYFLLFSHQTSSCVLIINLTQPIKKAWKGPINRKNKKSLCPFFLRVFFFQLFPCFFLRCSEHYLGIFVRHRNEWEKRTCLNNYKNKKSKESDACQTWF